MSLSSPSPGGEPAADVIAAGGDSGLDLHQDGSVLKECAQAGAAALPVEGPQLLRVPVPGDPGWLRGSPGCSFGVVAESARPAARVSVLTFTSLPGWILIEVPQRPGGYCTVDAVRRFVARVMTGPMARMTASAAKP